MAPRRLGRSDWIRLGLDLLRDEGGEALSLDRLCAHAGKTKGSFYHHFESLEAFQAAWLEQWRDQATEAIISATEAVKDPTARRAMLSSLADVEDHRLEAMIRLIAARSPNVAEALEAVDQRREGFIGQLIAEEFGKGPDEAAALGRLIYAVFVMGQMRAPNDIRAFIGGPQDFILQALKRGV